MLEPEAAAATVSAVLRLSGGGLWPFSTLQRSALKGVVLAALGAADGAANVAAGDLTVGTAEVSAAAPRGWAGRRCPREMPAEENPVTYSPAGKRGRPAKDCLRRCVIRRKALRRATVKKQSSTEDILNRAQ